MKNHTRYEVTFVVEVDDADGSDLVEEAVTSLLGEELRAHEEGGTRCGVRFFDVLDVNASFFERVP